jgi:hypothetical protein
MPLREVLDGRMRRLHRAPHLRWWPRVAWNEAHTTAANVPPNEPHASRRVATTEVRRGGSSVLLGMALRDFAPVRLRVVARE